MLLGQVKTLNNIQMLLQDKVTFYAIVSILVLIIVVSILQIFRRKRQEAKTFADNSQKKEPLQPAPPAAIKSEAPKPDFSSITRQAPVPSVTPSTPPAFVPPTYQATEGYKPTEQTKYKYAFDQNINSNKNVLDIDMTTLPTSDRKNLYFGGMTEPLSLLLPESDETKSKIKEELVHAGYFSPFAWHNLAAIRYLGIVLPLILCGILLLIVPPAVEFYVIILMIVLPIIGWAVPRLVVRNQAKERISQIEYGMPDMIDMLNMCVSQGLPLLPSLKKVATELKQVHPPLSRELDIVSHQAEVGNIKHALQNFSKRTNSQEVHSFTSLLLQTEQMGTSVSDALGTYSDNMRSTLNQRAEQKSNTASFKLLFPTVLCFMPAVFMFLLGPAIVELSNFYYGGGRSALQETTRSAFEVLSSENR